MLDTTTPTTTTSTIESVRLQKTSHLQNQNPWTYEITNIFDSAREEQKKELEENDSVVFLTLSMGDAHSIVAELYRAENWENGKIPLFSIPGNENWDMKLYFSTQDVSPTCGDSYPTPTDSGRIPTPSFVTSKPTQAPILLHGGSANESQPYQDNVYKPTVRSTETIIYINKLSTITHCNKQTAINNNSLFTSTATSNSASSYAATTSAAVPKLQLRSNNISSSTEALCEHIDYPQEYSY